MPEEANFGQYAALLGCLTLSKGHVIQTGRHLYRIQFGNRMVVK